MQGERASIGSFSEANGSSSTNPLVDQQIRWGNLQIIGDNDLQSYMNTAADTNTSFANSVYPEQSNLHRFSLGEASSSGAKNEAPTITKQWMAIRHLEELRNDKVELNPLFMQPPSANHNEGMNPVTGHPSLFQTNGPENGVRVGSSVDGQRKRKALDAGIGQSSSNVGFREVNRGESSSLVSASSFYSPTKNDLNMSLDHGPRGLVPVAVQNLSAPPAIPEKNFSGRVNPETVFAAGTVIREPIAPSLSAPGGHVPPLEQQLMELRNRHGFGNYASLNPNASAASIAPLSRNMIPPFQWSGSPVATAGGSSSSAVPVDRNVVHPVEARQRSNMLAPPGMINLPHGHVSGPGQVAQSPSRTGVQPSPALTPHQNNSAHNQRRLSEHLRRRSLLSSLATNHIAARSSAPPASLAQHVLQSGGGTTFQPQNRAYSRAVPQSLRGLAFTSRGRGRLAELRNVLEQMRRTGTLRLEDVMLLNQSMLGAAGIHDRYRDMRLDVDNMSYEELLSLGERIGDVCTGLNEETISNRLKQHKYTSDTRCPQEIEPCCVCQEEYNEGEELGKLECGHGFHSQCIKEWLKQKNICPICKTTGLNTVEKPGIL
ncbi:RING/U-box superfamily protein [Raphanus sativus]|uniref:RING-type E3 ubiquitin transferase n=1 Tax=Raphanus sativus TaxID=3726 RepID=A0A6J0K456_RAPSA|nr:probable E3 ubiquitin-protein ligase RHG1A [Raphanus sativus]XP_018441408.1 probable E3 ubiquitin-protein ligase RHG1A [Raphanus sativus]KAJ4917374.1 RING/U-box superfamily protein [Raphanus sativus]